MSQEIIYIFLTKSVFNIREHFTVYKMNLYLPASITLTMIAIIVSDNRLKERFSWSKIEIDYSSFEGGKVTEQHGTFKPENNFISSIEIWRDYLFLALPRLKPGVASTLNYISILDRNISPILKPFPSWNINYNLNATVKTIRMVSVHSLRVDTCNRLWALDSGISDELQARRIESPPSLFVYNLFDKTLIRKYSFKEEHHNGYSKFRNIVVDVNYGNCENAFAYIADSKNGLIVYSWDSNNSHKLTNNYFSFEPIWGNFKTSGGTVYQLNEGLLGMALSMPNKEGYRELFFQPLAGIMEFRVRTSILRNKTMARESFRHVHLLGNRGSNMQSSACVLDLDTGVFFYTTVIKNGVACWNSFRGDNITPENQGIINEFDEYMSYPADIKVDVNGTLWVLTNRLIDFIYEKKRNITYHIYKGSVRSLIKNTPCSLL